MICVLCGKEYKRSVTAAHIASHDITERTYAKRAKALSDEAWALYWKDGNADLRGKFPKPHSDKAGHGRFVNFAAYAREVAAKAARG